MTRLLARQATRFCVVGLVNTVVDVLVLNLLIFLAGTGHTGPLFTAFKTISFLVALLNSYYMNSRWTFAESNRNGVTQGAQFVGISVVGAVVNIASASYVAIFTRPPIELAAYWPTVAALVGTLASFVFNFVGYKYLVFGNREAA